MASATKLFKTVPTTTYKDVEDGVSLKLSKAEALALSAVLSRIGGPADSSARGYTQAVQNALSSAGIIVPYESFRENVNVAGSIYFRDGSTEIIKRLAGVDLYAGIIDQQYIAEAKKAAEVQTKANEQKRAIGLSPALGAGFIGQLENPFVGGKGLAAGAAIQNCLDKIPAAGVPGLNKHSY